MPTLSGCLICEYSTELVLFPDPTTTEFAESTPTELTSRCKCTAYTWEFTHCY